MAFFENIFGFRLKGNTGTKEIASVITPPNPDGSIVIGGVEGSHYGLTLDIEGIVKTENDLIRRYREVAQLQEVDSAIEDIINESIVTDQKDYPVQLQLDQLTIPAGTKKKFQEEFQNILNILEFNNRGHDIFRQWYVDGRLYAHILFEKEQTKKGIAEIRMIDPRKIKKVKQLIKERNPQGIEVVTATEEYYVYNEKGITETNITGVKMSLDSIVMCGSGNTDGNTGMLIGFLNKAIKPANQLKMIEDAIVIYRVTRAPERRIFYIDVGNLPKFKAEQYVTDMMNKFKNKLVYDAHTGEVSDSKRHLCLAMDTRVPLLDGRTLTLEEISQEYIQKQLWAYSCDPITGKFEPGLITWAGVARKDAPVMKITLDNGESITCTPEHKFPVWSKGFVKAEDMVVGESIIPLYKRTAPVGKQNENAKEYEQIWDNEDKMWRFTHREVSKWKDSHEIDNQFLFDNKYDGLEAKTVHHKNINRFDNSPDNLVRMHSNDHIAWHRNSGSGSGKIGGRHCYEMGKGYHNKSHPDYFKWHSDGGKLGGVISGKYNLVIARKVLSENFEDKDWNNWFRAQQSIGWTDEIRECASQHAKKNKLSDRGNAAQKKQFADKNSELSKKHTKKYKTEYPEGILELIIEGAKLGLTTIELLDYLNNNTEILLQFRNLNNMKIMTQKDYSYINKCDIGRIMANSNYSNYKQLKESLKFRNHKVVKIELLSERTDTGCLTIDGDNLYNNHHTFALEAGIYTQNSMMEDFWLPRRDGGKGTEITTLPGAQNLSALDDLEYFKKKLMLSLNVPISRTKEETGFTLGQSQTITRDELKFNKFVGKLRLKFSTLFSDLLKVQLISKGIIALEDWNDIKSKIRFDYIRDNYFTELKNIEIAQTKLGALQLIDQYSGKYYSKHWIQKNILAMDDEEIVDIDKEIKEEGLAANPVVPGMPTVDANGELIDQMPQEQPEQPDETDAKASNAQMMQQSDDLHQQKLQHNDELHQARLRKQK